MTINGTRKLQVEQIPYFRTCLDDPFSPLFFVYLKVDPSNFSLKNTSATLIPLIMISLIIHSISGCIRGGAFQGLPYAGIRRTFQKQMVSSW